MNTPALPVAANADAGADFDQLMNRPATTGGVNHLMFDDIKMERMIRTAQLMASGKSTIPAHLRDSVGDCLAIVIQSAQWNMNPWSVAQKTHLVNGVLGYEAQLVNAVIITRAPIAARPEYEWFGDWSQVIGQFTEKTGQNGKPYLAPGWKKEIEAHVGVRVRITMIGETEPRELELLLVQAQVRNSTLWGSDPKQQLAYLAIKRWARLYCPDVLLGVYSADELEQPEAPPVATQPSATSRAEAMKQKIRESAAPAPVTQPTPAINPDYPPPEGMNPETGEIQPIDDDPIADLILAISECQTREELELHRDSVGNLKNGLKKRAVAAWKEAMARIEGQPAT